MASRACVEDFVAQKRLALVGASRDRTKFGTYALRELKSRGYTVVPVHPSAAEIEGEPCYPSLGALPHPVEGVLVVVPPEQAELVVEDAAAAGITRVWLQQGAESRAAVRYCEQRGISVIAGECILMFAKPTRSFHRVHRWVNGLVGRLPK